MALVHISCVLKKTFPLKGKPFSLRGMSAATHPPHCFFAVPQTVPKHGKEGFRQ